METNRTQGAFRALSDPTRRQILLLLSQQDMTIGEVAEQFPITRAAIKKHLAILQQGSLISVTAEGRERINRLRPEGLAVARQWLQHFDRFWDNKLDKLGQAIAEEKNHG